ncbi:MAG: hypothetical protein FJX62_15005 [Alphaproteobacteria bacterium]|nr:hypothetical protein [Alphaproteobacteria bacterium]
MRYSLLALVALAFAAAPTASQAASGSVQLEVVKAAFIVGASGGGGTLRFNKRSYPLSVGGLSFGASIGASKANLVGRVSNIRSASDVAGTYGAITAGGAVITGGKVVRLRNEKGAILELRGREVGLELNLDVSGLVIGLR